jgi:2-dehydropantoate 2-reductase
MICSRWLGPSVPAIIIQPGERAMRLGIIGAGAIGSVVGGLLTKAGQDVTFIDQWPDHVEALTRVGLR